MNKIVKFLTLFLCFALLLNNAVFAQTLIYDEADEISAKEQLLNQNDNRIIVKYKENTEIVRLAKSDMKAKNKEYQIVNTLNDEKIQVLEVTNGNMNDVLCELSDNDNVEYAQPDYKVQISSDNFSEKLWAIQNNGQTIDGSTGVEGFDIGILQAWNSTKGNEETIIGVIDTGIDINHTALCDNIWTNEREIADNNIDDDGNGFVDDVNGWDFVNNDNTVYDSTVFDEHGTHVAGIIAGKNTEKSFSGVAPNVKIMPLKALNYNSGYTSDILAAIEYASSVGIKILNCSFSGLDYNEALADAISSHPNILFVCAAGNYGKNTNELITFPACYDASNILSVAAVNNKGVIAPFSTYGEEIDVAAPGMNIYSTLPNNEYGFKDGTSSAAAYASGIAALICDVDKTTNPIQLKEKIIQSCNKEVVAYDETLGVVDANEALDEHVKWYSNITEDDVKKDNGLPFIFDKNDQGTVKLTIYTIGYETASLSVSNYLQEELSELVYQNNSILNGEQEIQGLSSEIEYNFTLKISDEDITSSYSGCLLIDSEGNCNLYNIISNVYIIPQNNGDMQLMSDGTKWELESNNVYELADIIYDDYDVYGYISSTSDVDYFKVKFSSSGSANFWLGNIQNNCNYNMQIRDANDEYIAGSFNAKQADIARADYCLVYPSSSFAYAFLPSGTLDTGTGFRRTIKPDMSNEFAFDVIAIQRALVAYGYIDSAEIPIDEYGYYGPTTQAAIREYQDATLGFNTGNVSTQTIAKLFNSNNKKQKEQSTFAMLSNINIYKGRHDAVCAAVEAQVKNRGFTTYREGFLYHAGLKELGGRFDVAGVSGSNKQVWEIKPDSAYGRLTGPLQVATYVAASNNADNLNHWNYRAYCPLSLGNDITSGTIAWKPGEQISYYSKGDIANKGVVYYNILKNLQPLFEPALSPYIVPKPNEDYARISMPSGETLKNGLITAGVTVVALFVIKEAVGLLLAPASGGASLILCF